MSVPWHPQIQSTANIWQSKVYISLINTGNDNIYKVVFFFKKHELYLNIFVHSKTSCKYNIG